METKAELEKRINNLKTVIESYKRDLTDAEQQLEAYVTVESLFLGGNADD